MFLEARIMTQKCFLRYIKKEKIDPEEDLDMNDLEYVRDMLPE